MFLVVRECGLAHKTIIFTLDEFDQFAQARMPCTLPFCNCGILALDVSNSTWVSYFLLMMVCTFNHPHITYNKQVILGLKSLIMVLPISIVWYFQGKQRLLYSLLDAMNTVTSQAVVIGVSCRLVCCLFCFPTFPLLFGIAIMYYMFISIMRFLCSRSEREIRPN